MKTIEVAVKNGRAWIVCPYCGKGTWINVPENYVCKKAKCVCEESFSISFFRRISDRKKFNVAGTLKSDKSKEHLITLKDLSLQGVGIVIYSAKVEIGEEYDISFSFSDDIVDTAMKIVSLRGGIVGGKFIFIDEFCNAKLSVRRIWTKLSL